MSGLMVALFDAMLPGPPAIWESEWVSVPASAISAEDIVNWPSTTGILVKWVAFLGTPHWPAGGSDLGVDVVSYVELQILYELWAGERFTLEKAHPRYLRPGRPNSVSAVPFGPGIDIWRSCRCIGALMRSLCLLPGGRGRFVPCSIGANHCRLRLIGWEKCGHGLTSRPRQSASEPFLDELLGLFRYPLGSSPQVLCCSVCLAGPPLGGCRFLVMLLIWLLLVLVLFGRILLTVLVREFTGVSGSGPGRKRIRLNRKTPARLVGSKVHSHPRVWKRLRHVGFSSVSIPDH